MSGLFISGNISKIAIRPDEKALTEYERLRKESLMSPVEQFHSLLSNFVFVHLNIRSFKAHFEDIESDCVLTDCDLMLFSEVTFSNIVQYCPRQQFLHMTLIQ